MKAGKNWVPSIWRRHLFAVAGLVALLVILSASASAHAELRSSDPAAGSRLDTPPVELRLWFTEAVEPELTSVRVLDAGMEARFLGELQYEEEGRLVVVSLLEELPTGGYVVSWETVSRIDGHRTFGSIPFVIGLDAAFIEMEGSHEGRGPDVGLVVGKSAMFIGLTGIVGVFAFWWFVSPRELRPVLVGVTDRTGLAFAWVHLGGLGVYAVARSISFSMGPVEYLTGTPFARALGARLVLAGLLVALWHLARSRSRISGDGSTWVWPYLWPFAVVHLVMYGWASHTASYLGTRWLGTLVDIVHLGAIGIWVGGLVLLFLASGVFRREAKIPVGMSRLASRFSWTAFVMVVLAVVTGLLMTGALVGFNEEQWSSRYARLLGVKLALAGLMVVLGAVNKLLYVARAAKKGFEEVTLKGFRSNVGREVAIAVLVIGLAGMMTNLSPPLVTASTLDGLEGQKDPLMPREDLVLTSQTANYDWTVTLRPYPAPGEESRFTVELFDSSTQSRERDARSVVIEVRNLDNEELGDARVRAQITEAGVYVANATVFPFAGHYRVTIIVDTPIAYQEQVAHELHIH